MFLHPASEGRHLISICWLHVKLCYLVLLLEFWERWLHDHNSQKQEKTIIFGIKVSMNLRDSFQRRQNDTITFWCLQMWLQFHTDITLYSTLKVISLCKAMLQQVASIMWMLSLVSISLSKTVCEIGHWTKDREE